MELTATSRTSFWPPFSVFRALRMGGSCSVSNLTVGQGASARALMEEIAGVVCGVESRRRRRCGAVRCVAWRLDRRRRGKRFSRTIDDGTDDLVNLAITGGVGAGEPLAQGRSERGLDWLEGALKGGRTAESRSPQRPGDAATGAVWSAFWQLQKGGGQHCGVPAEHCDGSREGIDGSGEVMEMEVGLLGG